ncbi:MAG: hypothetical protein LAP87_24120 [Acidobacteriia bacterium]|nr:hypothetical protein [Terriglobia bacterium]
MNAIREYRIDPEELDGDGAGAELEVVVPYTDPTVTAAVLERVQELTAGLRARVSLMAVQALPYPLPFVCPTAVHAYLAGQLTELAGHCALPVTPQVVLARDRQEGFRHALKPASTVVVGTRRRFFRSMEEKLARSLARDGHNVVLVHVA